jgi:hypothetical protein
MLADSRAVGARSRRPSAQAGTAAVEVALLSIVFFLVVFGALEVTRLMYVFNTLQEVTRHAASDMINMAPAEADSTAMKAVRRRAIFQQTGDDLILAAPITFQHVRVDYLSLVRDPISGTLTRVPTWPLPTCAATNRQTCMADPNSAACIRFVRVRICDPLNPGTCDAVRYQPLLPLVDLNVALPRSSTIATAESLGYLPGMAPCP